MSCRTPSSTIPLDITKLLFSPLGMSPNHQQMLYIAIKAACQAAVKYCGFVIPVSSQYHPHVFPWDKTISDVTVATSTDYSHIHVYTKLNLVQDVYIHVNKLYIIMYILYNIKLYYIMLYHIISYHIILYYIILYYIYVIYSLVYNYIYYIIIYIYYTNRRSTTVNSPRCTQALDHWIPGSR